MTNMRSALHQWWQICKSHHPCDDDNVVMMNMRSTSHWWWWQCSDNEYARCVALVIMTNRTSCLNYLNPGLEPKVFSLYPLSPIGCCSDFKQSLLQAFFFFFKYYYQAAYPPLLVLYCIWFWFLKWTTSYLSLSNVITLLCFRTFILPIKMVLNDISFLG